MKRNPTLAPPTFHFVEDNNYYISPEVIKDHANATWNSQRGDVPITSMDNDYLQKAFEDIQYLELKLLKKLEEANKIKEHLLYEARKRNFALRWLDEIKGKPFGYVFQAERAVRKLAIYCPEKKKFRDENIAKFREEFKARKQVSA